jgi:alpha-L-fucosidase
MSGSPNEFAGDFASPEQIIPPNGLKNVKGEPVVWEACLTMNNDWGYTELDKNFKPAPMLIKKLVECVSKGGNMLLNVGPDAKGNIPCESLEILAQIGKWMRKNGESVYGCGLSGLEKPEFGRITRKGKTFYYHVTENQVGVVPLMGLKREQIKEIRLLSSGAEMKITNFWAASNYPDLAFISFGDSPILPDQTDTVVAVETI